MPRLTTIDGCAIERDYVYLAQMVDDYGFDAEFSRMSFYDAQSATPWVAHDLHWKTTSVCAWTGSPFGARVYVAMSTEGDVEILGPGGEPTITEHIIGAGLDRPWSRQLGLMLKVRQVAQTLYACGSGYAVFRRGEQGWETMPSSLDINASAADGHFFYDVNGTSKDSLYAVGLYGSGSGIIAHYDGTTWFPVVHDVPGSLSVIIGSERGGYYVGGSKGLVLYGDRKRGFEVGGTITTNQGSTLGMAEYNGVVFIASTNGLYSLTAPGRPITAVQTNLRPALTDVSKLSVAGGVLWSFGAKDLAYFDGKVWTRVQDPENLPNAP